MFDKKLHIAKDTYETFAGADWPSYADFVSNKTITNKKILLEIERVSQIQKKIDAAAQIRAIIKITKLLIPAALGVGLFFYFGGTWQKFFLVFLVFYFVNYFYRFTVHRWLTHNQVKVKKWAQIFLLWNSTLVGSIRLLDWVRMHISHHKFPNSEFDPYSPTIGLFRNLVWDTQEIHPSCKKFYFTNNLVNFFDKYYFHFYVLNLVIFSFIDIDFVLLSFALLKLNTIIIDGLGNYYQHDGGKTNQPINYPWWLEILRPGDGALHGEHHKFPHKFNLSNGNLVDFMIFCKIFTEERHKKYKKVVDIKDK
jgi:fatty-acid desaturase